MERPDWYAGLPLAERLPPPSAPSDPAAAQRRLKRWVAQRPFDEERWLVRRLAIDGLDETAFRALLGEDAASLAARLPRPAWWHELRLAYLESARRPMHTVPKPARSEGAEALLWLVAPLMRRAVGRLEARARDLVEAQPEAPFRVATAVPQLFAPAVDFLSRLVGRTLVLEMHVAKHQGRLRGETAEERFASFVERLRDPVCALSLLAEYPVLARQAVLGLADWVDFAGEFLTRLANDARRLEEELFAGESLGTLQEISGGGDRHRGGRTVLLCRFSSGRRVVYKPKSLALDHHFADLLVWLAERGGPRLRCPQVVDRGEYGWSRFVEHRLCGDGDGLRRFYHRQGALLAVLHLLQATDFHNENLIADGEYPVPVDLESLFRGELAGVGDGEPESPALAAFADSVLVVGLLPHRSGGGRGEGGVETSGLGGAEGQRTLRAVPLWADSGSDEMRVVRQHLVLAPAQNRPKLGERAADPLQHADDLVAGFAAAYRSLLEHRDELLADDGPLARFRDDPIRTIVRHTQFYTTLLHETQHPDVLRNALDRDRCFDRLWFGAEETAWMERLIDVYPAERRNLWRGDVPFFHTRVDQRDAWTADGERLPGFLRESGLQAVRRRAHGMGEEDLELQTWLLRGSLTALAMDSEKAGGARRSARTAERSASAEELLAAADELGDRLAELAVWRDGEVGWLGAALVGDHGWSILPLGLDLYGGVPGVALFLAYLGELTGEARHRDLAATAVATLRRRFDAARPRLPSVGGYEGLGGLVHAWSHLSALWQDRELAAEAEELARQMGELAGDDDSLDVLSGAAGGVASLVALHRVTGSPAALASARRLADHLLQRAEKAETGVGWRVPVAPERPLTGFSHGASGFAWALCELHTVEPRPDLLAAVRGALAYEDGLFVAEADNWPDLRTAPGQEEAPPGFMYAWCHGAPGIGLARLRMLRHLGDASLEQGAAAALRTVARSGFGGSHCLCHGELGNLELFLEAAANPRVPQPPLPAARVAAGILDAARREGWRCGVPLHVETPGLMVGLAGIGYQLLRLAAPERVPSVLLLDPPTGVAPAG